jgi:hypothetical protein
MRRNWMAAVGVGVALWAMWTAGVARAQTPEPTRPLSPTVAVSPTVAMTQTAAAGAWFDLTDESGAFSLEFPPNWTAAQSEPGAMLLRGPEHDLAYVSVFTLPVTQTEEAAVGDWVAAVKPAWAQRGQQVVADERGRWDRGLSGASARVTMASGQTRSEQLFIVSRRPDGRVVSVSDAWGGGMLTEGNLATLERILKSLKVSPAADQPLTAPVRFLNQRQTGIGPRAEITFHLLARQATFQLTFDGRSPFVVWLADDQGQRVDLLVNRTGPLYHVYSLAVPHTGDYTLQITGAGGFEISVAQ